MGKFNRGKGRTRRGMRGHFKALKKMVGDRL